jgi:predicted NACHT family NTPase
VTVREVSGGREQAQGNEFEVGEDAMKEALGTGLFSSRGLNRLGWAHQTYAEFLAAHYLAQHQMTLTQMMNLIVHPGDPEKKLIPQLHETAAWLARMMPEVFRKIMESDPEVLLRSDVATAEEADRAALVHALLEKCDAEQSLLHHD